MSKPIENCEEAEVDPTCKRTGCSVTRVFTDAGFTPKTAGSETKRSITHDTESSLSFGLMYLPLALQIPQKQQGEAQEDPVHTAGICISS